ncbi:MAG: DUF3037 domain-containing protein [Phycisphaerales bacterium]|nr:DUF3037 domain-containing protein [Phycisphaerales bacterium]
MHSVKTSTYIYSLLQYRHSQILGEVLNIGLLIYVPNVKQFRFIYPKKLARISTVYPEVQEKTIRHYLRSFAISIGDLNRDPDIFSHNTAEISFIQFIAENILPPDSSALQFSETKKGILSFEDLSKSDDLASISKKLYNLYFAAYDSLSIDSTKIDEHQIISSYKTYLRENGLEIENTSARINYDFEINTNYGEKFKFDVAWQNGTLNLVKPISFDLSRPIDVQNKSLRFFGQFTHLQDYAKSKGINFDLLVAKPKNYELQKHYLNAINLLGQPKYVRVIKEDEIYDYSKKTVETIQHTL